MGGVIVPAQKADRDRRPWTDLRRAAAWRGTEFFGLEDYLARMSQPLHPLARSKFAWRFFFFLDFMHIMDCKGLTSSIAGSILFLLVRDVRLGPNQQSRMDVINTKLKGFYSRHKHLNKLPKLKLQNIVGSSGWAEMSGPAIKAAGTRSSAPFFRELAEEYFNGDSQEDRDVRRITSKLERFYDIIGNAPMIMNDDELNALDDTCADLGIALQSLRHAASIRKELVWQVRPKAHKAMHLPFFASVVNPHFLNCYVRESQIGTSQKVWRSVVKGVWRPHAQKTVIAKRWLGVLLRVEADF